MVRDEQIAEINALVLDTIREANPDWVSEDGACSRCWEEYERL